MTDHRNEEPRLPGFDRPQAETPQTLSTSEAAERLGLKQRQTQRLAKTGVLQCAMDENGQYRIYTAAVDAYRQQRALRQRPAPIVTDAQIQAVTAPQLTALLQRMMALEARMLAVERERVELVDVLKQEVELLSALLTRRQRATQPPQPPRPKPPTQRAKVLEALQQATRPRRARQLAQTLGLTVKQVQRELSRLVEDRKATKPRLGVYVAVDSPIWTESEGEELAPPSTLERVFQTVAEADHPLEPHEVKKRLQMNRRPSPELSKLYKNRRLLREMGKYRVPKPGEVTQSAENDESSDTEKF